MTAMPLIYNLQSLFNSSWGPHFLSENYKLIIKIIKILDFAECNKDHTYYLDPGVTPIIV